MAHQRILVPCDFMEDSFNALQHAAFIAKQSNAEIILLHLIKEEHMRPAAETTIQEWANRLKAEFAGVVRTSIAQGEIIEDIAKFADKEDCQLIVLPTHGMHGSQLLTGSLALFVVSESHRPFVVVQKRPIREHGYKKLVIPIDFRPQLADEVDVFLKVARTFGSEVYFIVNNKFVHERDASVLDVVKEKFESAGIDLHVHTTSLFNFTKAVLEYAASVDADLICAINFAYENLYSLFPRTEEEDLIYNAAQIPVMLVTPQEQDDNLAYLPYLAG